jgi:hypothetical protein
MYPQTTVPRITGNSTSASDWCTFISFIRGEEQQVIENLVSRPSRPPTTAYAYAYMMGETRWRLVGLSAEAVESSHCRTSAQNIGRRIYFAVASCNL